MTLYGIKAWTHLLLLGGSVRGNNMQAMYFYSSLLGITFCLCMIKWKIHLFYFDIFSISHIYFSYRVDWKNCPSIKLARYRVCPQNLKFFPTKGRKQMVIWRLKNKPCCDIIYLSLTKYQNLWVRLVYW